MRVCLRLWPGVCVRVSLGPLKCACRAGTAGGRESNLSAFSPVSTRTLHLSSLSSLAPTYAVLIDRDTLSPCSTELCSASLPRPLSLHHDVPSEVALDTREKKEKRAVWSHIVDDTRSARWMLDGIIDVSGFVLCVR